MTLARRGLVLILASPSGAGKSTLARAVIGASRGESNPVAGELLRDGGPLTLSVSVTTRPQRASEIDGVHYHFIDKARFLAMRDAGELLEWAEVHGNFYGTPRGPVEKALAAGQDMLFDIDWQGTVQVQEKIADDVVAIFVLPPSMAELETRLNRRAEDSAEVIARRLANARTEIAEWRRFNYVVVNDNLQRAFVDIAAILHAERLRRERVVGLEGFVETLLA